MAVSEFLKSRGLRQWTGVLKENNEKNVCQVDNIFVFLFNISQAICSNNFYTEFMFLADFRNCLFIVKVQLYETIKTLG